VPTSVASEIADIDDPTTFARAAGLRYSTDASPGIHRRRAGRGWRYFAPDGKPVSDSADLARIRDIAVPPAWTDVWINPSPHGHLQATGRDARGRKQYRYHPCWRSLRDSTKFSRLIAFGQALPLVRERVARDLALPGLPREKVLATVVRLLDESLIRVGNEEYARDNGSYGLTTLREDHVDVSGATLHCAFRAKGGAQHEVDVRDPQVARIVRRLQELPGQELFQYRDDSGETCSLGSQDVNAYLREIAGEEFTAKDFRTWAGTVLAVSTLRQLGQGANETECKANVISAVDTVAKSLGNTRAVCRSSYIHPAILAGYEDGSLCGFTHRGGSLRLSPDERLTLAYLTEVEEPGDGERKSAKSQ
jgi:DNA topoisomerase-1